jgi:hypothetical protein
MGVFRLASTIQCYYKIILTHYEIDGAGIESRLRRNFPQPFRRAVWAHRAPCIIGNGCFPGVKQPGRGVDHPVPHSAEVKGLSYTSTPHLYHHGILKGALSL